MKTFPIFCWSIFFLTVISKGHLHNFYFLSLFLLLIPFFMLTLWSVKVKTTKTRRKKNFHSHILFRKYPLSVCINTSFAASWRRKGISSCLKTCWKKSFHLNIYTQTEQFSHLILFYCHCRPFSDKSTCEKFDWQNFNFLFKFHFIFVVFVFWISHVRKFAGCSVDI